MFKGITVAGCKFLLFNNAEGRQQLWSIFFICFFGNLVVRLMDCWDSQNGKQKLERKCLKSKK